MLKLEDAIFTQHILGENVKGEKTVAMKILCY